MPLKVSELITLLERDGWFRVKAKGGHRQFKHEIKQGRVTVSGKPSDTLRPGTEKSILSQAGLNRRP
jgi:predicted RNA binding protein YcfA (HicA-like mRNA interferase family)